MIKLKDKTQKEIVKGIIRIKNTYLNNHKDSDIVRDLSAAETRTLLQILWYSKGIDLETKRRLTKYMSEKIYKNSYI